MCTRVRFIPCPPTCVCFSVGLVVVTMAGQGCTAAASSKTMQTKAVAASAASASADASTVAVAAEKKDKRQVSEHTRVHGYAPSAAATVTAQRAASGAPAQYRHQQYIAHPMPAAALSGGGSAEQQQQHQQVQQQQPQQLADQEVCGRLLLAYLVCGAFFLRRLCVRCTAARNALSSVRTTFYLFSRTHARRQHAGSTHARTYARTIV